MGLVGVGVVLSLSLLSFLIYFKSLTLSFFFVSLLCVLLCMRVVSVCI